MTKNCTCYELSTEEQQHYWCIECAREWENQ